MQVFCIPPPTVCNLLWTLEGSVVPRWGLSSESLSHPQYISSVIPCVALPTAQQRIAPHSSLESSRRTLRRIINHCLCANEMLKVLQKNREEWIGSGMIYPWVLVICKLWVSYHVLFIRAKSSSEVTAAIAEVVEKGQAPHLLLHCFHRSLLCHFSFSYLFFGIVP